MLQWDIMRYWSWIVTNLYFIILTLFQFRQKMKLDENGNFHCTFNPLKVLRVTHDCRHFDFSRDSHVTMLFMSCFYVFKRERSFFKPLRCKISNKKFLLGYIWELNSAFCVFHYVSSNDLRKKQEIKSFCFRDLTITTTPKYHKTQNKYIDSIK